MPESGVELHIEHDFRPGLAAFVAVSLAARGVQAAAQDNTVVVTVAGVTVIITSEQIDALLGRCRAMAGADGSFSMAQAVAAELHLIANLIDEAGRTIDHAIRERL